MIEKGGANFLLFGGLVAFAIGFIYLVYIRARYTYNPSADNDSRAAWVSYSVIFCVVGLMTSVVGVVMASA